MLTLISPWHRMHSTWLETTETDLMNLGKNTVEEKYLRSVTSKIFTYLFSLIRKRKRERSFSIHWVTVQTPTTVRVGSTNVTKSELHPGFPSGCQGPKYLSHHLMNPGVYISRKLNWKQRWDSSHALQYGMWVSQAVV